jgi:hypothetical protein
METPPLLAGSDQEIVIVVSVLEALRAVGFVGEVAGVALIACDGVEVPLAFVAVTVTE